MSKKIVHINYDNKAIVKVLVTGLILLCSYVAIAAYEYKNDGNDLLYACTAAINAADNPQQHLNSGNGIVIVIA